MFSSSVTTTATDMSSPARLIARHPLVAFFALTYALSWLITLPLLLGTNGLNLLPYTVPRRVAFLLTVVQSYGPTIVGLALATCSGYGARRLMRRYLRWSTGVRWYLVVLAGTPLTILLGAMLLRGVSAWQSLALAGMPDLLMLVLTYLINVVVLMFLGGPLGEEGGWRGFALPRLQRQYSPLVASGILGLLWVTWHLPNFFIPEMGTFQGNLLVYLTLGGALSVIHSWVSNRTAQSLLMVTLLHAAVDASTRTLLPPIFGADRATGNLVPLIGFGAWALLIILATCVRLGYHPSEHRA